MSHSQCMVSNSSLQLLIRGYFLKARLHTSLEVDFKKAACDLSYSEPTKWSSLFHPEPKPYCSASEPNLLVWAQWSPSGSYVMPGLELAYAQQAWSSEGAHSRQPTPFHGDILWVLWGHLQGFLLTKVQWVCKHCEVFFQLLTIYVMGFCTAFHFS